jgi:hypothetical protein
VERYQHLDADSGVAYYESGTDFIRVQFRNGSTYVYDYTRPGIHHVEHMKELARAGKGLTTYISQFVRASYARRER